MLARHSVCVWSILDLPTILLSEKIIINKVMTEHDPVIGECLRDSVKRREIKEQVDLPPSPGYDNKTTTD